MLPRRNPRGPALRPSNNARFIAWRRNDRLRRKVDERGAGERILLNQYRRRGKKRPFTSSTLYPSSLCRISVARKERGEEAVGGQRCPRHRRFCEHAIFQSTTDSNVMLPNSDKYNSHISCVQYCFFRYKHTAISHSHLNPVSNFEATILHPISSPFISPSSLFNFPLLTRPSFRTLKF